MSIQPQSPRADADASRTPPTVDTLSGTFVDGGVNLLRQEPVLVLWGLVGLAASSVLELLPLVFVFVMVVGWLGEFTGHGPLPALLGLGRWFSQPPVVTGVLGIFFTAAVASWLVGTVVETGVLGALRRRILAGSTIIEQTLFVKTLGERLSTVMTMSILRSLTLMALAVLMAGLGLGAARAWTLAGWEPPTGTGLVAAAIGGSLFMSLLIASAGVVMVWLHLSLSAMILSGHGLGDGLHAGFELMVRSPAPIARLYVTIALGFVVAYLAYLPANLLASSLADHPTLAALGVLAQVFVELTMAAALVALSIWARGASMSFVGLASGCIQRIPPRSRDTSGTDAALSASETLETTLSLADLLPERTDHVFRLDDIRRSLYPDDRTGDSTSGAE